MKKRLVITVLVFWILLPTFSVMAQSNPSAIQIEFISDDGFIVIGDTTFKIDSDARFFAQDERSPIPLSTFKEGDWVGFSVNSDGEIDELWLSSE